MVPEAPKTRREPKTGGDGWNAALRARAGDFLGRPRPTKPAAWRARAGEKNLEPRHIRAP